MLRKDNGIMNGNNPLVIVLSRNYSTGLSVIRSVGAAGYTVDLIASSYKKGDSAIAASSKYVRNAVEVVSKKVKEQKIDYDLLNEILKYGKRQTEKSVLFPTDDYTTSVMDQNRSLLEPYYIMPTIVGGGDGCLTRCMDKTFQGEIAKKVGILTPLEWIISLEGEIVIPADIVYPCFCKPIESVSGYKKEMAVCKNEVALRKHLEKLKKRFSHRDILVQEYLKIDNEIDLSGVCLDQEIIIPAIIKKLNVAKYERGVTLAGRVVPVEEIGELYEKIVEMMKQFHYIGMFDMEFNIVGDKLYFNEVNLRSGGPNYAYFMSGVNLPALFVKAALGESYYLESRQTIQYGKNFVYEKVAWEDYLHGYMSKKSLRSRIRMADGRLLEIDDDPVPGKLFKKRMRRAVCIKKLKTQKRNIINKIHKAKITVFKYLLPLIKGLRKAKYFILGYPQAKKANRRNPLAEKNRVIVSGRNYCSNLCMARSLGEAGYEVEVLRIFQTKPKFYNLIKRLKPDAYSKYVKAYHVCISHRKSKRIVNRLISLADKYRKMLLIPTDDLVANVVDQYYNKLSKYYLIPSIKNTQGEINRLMSKDTQKELAKAAGLPVLNSCLIRVNKQGVVEIPDSVTYPCFVKPNVSKNSSKSRMCKCENEEELFDTLVEFSKNKHIEMLVEDYVDIGKEYSMLGLSTKDGVVSPGFFCAEEGGNDERRGVALVGKIIPCEQEQNILDDINKFIESLHYEGLFDVDLIQTTDGKIYFVELNLRFGASGYAVTQSGVNLPGMFADYMYYGKPIDLDCEITEPGKLFISEKVMLEEYIKGYLTRNELNERMNKVDIHFVKNDRDPEPYLHFSKFYKIASLWRTGIKIKSKYLSTKVG